MSINQQVSATVDMDRLLRPTAYQYLSILMNASSSIEFFISSFIFTMFMFFDRHGGWEASSDLLEAFPLSLLALTAVRLIHSSARAGKTPTHIHEAQVRIAHWSDENARNEERNRLSRELHDVAGHKLALLKLSLGVMAADAANDDLVKQCKKITDDLILDIRRVVSSLRGNEEIDLRQSLIDLIPKLSKPSVRLEFTPAVGGFGRAESAVLLRCAQEGLANALRHGHAENIAIRLTPERGGVRLLVEDDGCALVVPAAGNGLRGMHERVEALNGQLEVGIREQCNGLRLSVWLPLASQDRL